MKEPVRETVEASKRDIEQAKFYLDREGFSNIVTYHCRRAVEKMLKALIEESSDSKAIHYIIVDERDLQCLFDKIPKNIRSSLKIRRDDLKKIDQICDDFRHPLDMGYLPTGLPTQKEAKRIYRIARKIFDRILQRVEGCRTIFQIFPCTI